MHLEKKGGFVCLLAIDYCVWLCAPFYYYLSWVKEKQRELDVKSRIMN